jgi:dUTP pyrophosphatase
MERTLERETVIFETLYDDAVAPSQATAGSAGYDVRAYLTGRTVEIITGTQSSTVEVTDGRLVIPPHARAAVPLGFRASMPHGIEAQLRLRSSLAFRRGLTMPNAPATIDSDYPGEWLVIVSNTLPEPVTIEHTERIAQIIFSRYECVEWTPGTVEVSSDRTGGFGSTGRH